MLGAPGTGGGRHGLPQPGPGGAAGRGDRAVLAHHQHQGEDWEGEGLIVMGGL